MFTAFIHLSIPQFLEIPVDNSGLDEWGEDNQGGQPTASSSFRRINCLLAHGFSTKDPN